MQLYTHIDSETHQQIWVKLMCVYKKNKKNIAHFLQPSFFFFLQLIAAKNRFIGGRLFPKTAMVITEVRVCPFLVLLWICCKKVAAKYSSQLFFILESLQYRDGADSAGTTKVLGSDTVTQQ